MDQPVPLSQAPAELLVSLSTVQCGFPSPAEDHQAERLDVSRLLVRNAEATFFCRVRGPSMRDAGIDDGDYVIVDRSVQAQHGLIVLAVIDGEFTIKRLFKRAGRVKLCAANPTFSDIEIRDAQELVVWGVVTWTLKKHLHAVSH
ncbi:MAG: translesion error-prone DNA polymerase V autoproteolytic subunit [Pigmentiphaga sp.]|nr:translesion error-prone DNA polymerase V autoproteolytic subunit [Pigmentiphaga sp.]